VTLYDGSQGKHKACSKPGFKKRSKPASLLFLKAGGFQRFRVTIHRFLRCNGTQSFGESRVPGLHLELSPHLWGLYYRWQRLAFRDSENHINIVRNRSAESRGAETRAAEPGLGNPSWGPSRDPRNPVPVSFSFFFFYFDNL
jgi:hypothetical protein